MSLAALPSWDQVQQVDALCGLARVLAGVAGELDLEDGEDREAGALVALAHEGGVEIDLRRKRRNRQKARGVDGHERGNRLVEEPRVDVGCLLQDDDVAPGSLGGSDLPTHKNISFWYISQMTTTTRVSSLGFLLATWR